MKKISRGILILGLLLTLTACGSKKVGTAGSSKESGGTDMSSSQVAGQEAVFTATVETDATLDGENISLKLNQIHEEEDPEKVLASLSEGVTLKVTKDNFSTEFSEGDFKAGTQVRVVLEALPMMTKSIPPQIPGKSVISISLATTDQSSAKVDSFTAKLTEDARIDDNHPEGVFLTLEDLQVTGDTPADAAAFGNNGLVLNASMDNFSPTFQASDYLAGTKIKFTLQSPTAMTASIPPQIPGNAILVIERAE